MLLLERISCVASPVSSVKSGLPRALGRKMGRLDVAENRSIAIEEDRIVAIGDPDAMSEEYAKAERVDCRDKTLLPGWVDSHTHLVFAGNRSNEFADRLRGKSYQEIYEAGGGIRASMQAVRDASLEEIVERVRPLIENAFAHGSTTIEVKSGYGLDTASEVKLLEAIRLLDEQVAPTLVPTFLGAHAFPPEYEEDHEAYVRVIIDEMIPEVGTRGLAEYCDVFTDEGYFTINQSERILEAARRAGMRIRVHADELADVGAATMAARMGARSADHLLNISKEGIEEMVASDVIATLLPGTAFYLNLPYAPARKLIQSGLAVALATDCNPGSNLCEVMPVTLALACNAMRMSVEESITAATLNGAAALDRSDRIGRIEVGMTADLVLYNVANYPDLLYHYGVNHARLVIKEGKVYEV